MERRQNVETGCFLSRPVASFWRGGLSRAVLRNHPILYIWMRLPPGDYRSASGRNTIALPLPHGRLVSEAALRILYIMMQLPIWFC